MDPEIKGIYPTVPNDQNLVNPDPALRQEGFEFFEFESNRETTKNESFADNSNNFLLLEFETLLKIKNVLSEFRYLSGLECNVDKSFLMRFGDLSGEIEQRILDLGFPVTNELTILGFILSNVDDFVNLNFNKIGQKISGIIRFWEHFNLSLPGKISIYKTLLIPQINFIASILTPSDEFILDISTQMENFVTKGLNIAKHRLYLKPEQGGIGLF